MSAMKIYNYKCLLFVVVVVVVVVVVFYCNVYTSVYTSVTMTNLNENAL